MDFVWGGLHYEEMLRDVCYSMTSRLVSLFIMLTNMAGYQVLHMLMLITHIAFNDQFLMVFLKLNSFFWSICVDVNSY